MLKQPNHPGSHPGLVAGTTSALLLNFLVRMESNAAIEHDPTNTTLFIGGLDPSLSESELRAYVMLFVALIMLYSTFQPYGAIVYAKMLPEKNCGFVQFMFRAQAEAAMQGMHGQPVLGNKFLLYLFKPDWSCSCQTFMGQVAACPQTD